MPKQDFFVLLRLIFATVVCLLASSAIVLAQEFIHQGAVFNNLAKPGQHPLGRTRQILQDNRGFIWIATDAEGLFRFDGSQSKKIELRGRFEPLTVEPRIESILLDTQQHIWLRTAEHGLFRYDPKTQVSSHYDLKDIGLNSQITSLTIAPDGRLWLSSKRRLAVFDNQRKHWNLITNLNQHPLPQAVSIKKLFIDSQSRFWLIGETSGIYRLRPDQDDNHYSFDNDSGLLSNGILAVFQDAQQQLWFGTTKGVAVFNEQTNRFKTFKITNAPTQGYNQLVSSFAQKDQDHLYLGTFTSGVLLLNRDTHQTTPYTSSNKHSLNNHEVNHVFVDRDKTLWVSTEKGVSLSNVYTKAQEHWQVASARPCNPTGLVKRNNSVYFACANLLYRWQYTVSSIEIVKAFPAMILAMVAGKKENELWLGTMASGVIHYQINQDLSTVYAVTEQPKQFSNSVLRLHRDNHGVLWGASFDFQIGQQTEVFYFDDSQQQLVRFATTINPTSITSIDDNHLLLTNFMADDGIYIFDKQSGKMTNDPIDVGIIYSTFNDGQTIWLGTGKKGVVSYRRNPGTTGKTISIDSGFTAPFGLMTDGEHGVFFHDNDKLFHYQKATGLSYCLSCREPFVDLVSLYLGSMAFIDGQLMVGSKDRLVKLDISALPQVNTPPKIYFSDFSRFSRRVLPQPLSQDKALPVALEYLTNGLILGHKDTLFSIHFGALSLLEGDNIRFSYQLQGLDSLQHSWLEVPEQYNAATFTTLPSGEYQLRVKAHSELSGQTGHAVLPLTIKPAAWLTLPAKTSYLLLVIMIVIIVYRWRTQALQRQAQMLKQGIKERTAQLTESNQQLADKNETISTLLAQKRRIFANMSHELRTPLTLILSPLERLLKANFSDDTTKFLKMIDNNTRHLLRVVEQQLKLAQLESSNRIEYKQYQVNLCLGYIVASFEALAVDKSLSINTTTPTEFNAILIEQSLETIIANLLSNAIKYTPESGVIKLSIEKYAEHFILTVSDTGLGISEQNQQRIFEPFYRDLAESKSTISGSGIGLALCKELVEANQGKISLVSYLGQGSCFTIKLPLTPGKKVLQSQAPIAHGPIQSCLESLRQDNKEQATAAKLSLNLTSHLDKKPSIAIVEDNQQMREYLFDILSEDYHCLAAVNGQDGISLVVEQIPDIVLCDLMMPGIDGLQVCRTLKQDERTCHIPLLLLTAKSDVETRISGWQENIDDFVAKPFIEAELKAKLSNLVTIRRILAKRFSSRKTLDAKLSQISEKDLKFLHKFDRVVADNLHDETFNRSKAAANLAISERQLQRKLAALTDNSFTEYVRTNRLNAAKQQLAEDLQVGQVVQAVGFASISYFGSCFKAEFGMTPKQFQLHCRQQRAVQHS